jgi:hypothetical protein
LPYKVVSVTLAFIPSILVLGYYEETYAKEYMTYIDTLYSMFFIGEFIFRISLFGRNYLRSYLAQQEAFIAALLGITIAWTILWWLGAIGGEYLYIATYACIVARMHRLSSFLPQVAQYFHGIVVVIQGFIPLLAGLFCLVLVFSIIVQVIFHGVDMEYGDDFLNKHYRFDSLYHSAVTLVAMGTGNMWSEVLSELEKHFNLARIFYIEFLFTSFYVIFHISLKSLVILLISKFLNQSGDSDVLADQQIKQFRRAWNEVNPESGTVMTEKKLEAFLQKLETPLGFASPALITNYTASKAMTAAIASYFNKSGDDGRFD